MNSLRNRLQQAVNVRSGEWGQLIAFLILIMLNMIALESADVVATSSYLGEVGMNHLPLLWIADMIVILLSSVVYSLIADRFPRRNLLRGLMIGFGLSLLLIRLLISYGPTNFLYTILYIVVDQQLILFPLSFWALANDSYNVVTSKRLFPVISAGGLAGNVLGNWFASQAAPLLNRWGLVNDDLLFACSLAFFLALPVLTFAFRKSASTTPSSQQPEQRIDFRETWETGRDFVKNISLFRYLFLVLFLSEIVLTIVEYHFLAKTTERFTDPFQFQTFYGGYKAVLTIASLLLQLFLAGRLLEKIGLKNAFFLFPSTLFIGTITAAVFLNFVSAVGASVGTRIMLNSVEGPARKSIQGLIPDAKRGRVSTFLDSYVYATGTIVGCLILGGCILLGQNKLISPIAMIILYESLGAIIAAITLLFVFRLHKSYDESLWHPWLARRKRRSITTGLLKDL